MAKSRAAFNEDERHEEEQHHCLDPLLEVLAKYRSSTDLSESIRLVYNRLDVDGSGGVGMAEMRDGLPQVIHGIQFTGEDWYHLAEEVLRLRRREANKEGVNQEVASRAVSSTGSESEVENLAQLQLTSEVCQRARAHVRSRGPACKRESALTRDSREGEERSKVI